MIKKLFPLVWLLFISPLAVNQPLSAKDADEEEKKSLEVGEKARNFDLPLVGEDDYVELKDLYDDGPVVVIVLRGYPGYQCMLCRQQLGAMINRAKALKVAVHKVVLVYPGESADLERHAKQFMGSRSIPEPFVLVRDPGLKMVDDWGLRWKAPRETAYPATYIINSNGRVAWRKISDNHGGRVTAQEILQQLKKL